VTLSSAQLSRRPSPGVLESSIRLAFVFAVIAGEIANFVAYIYAPAVLVTPLGALSIIR